MAATLASITGTALETPRRERRRRSPGGGAVDPSFVREQVEVPVEEKVKMKDVVGEFGRLIDLD